MSLQKWFKASWHGGKRSRLKKDWTRELLQQLLFKEWLWMRLVALPGAKHHAKHLAIPKAQNVITYCPVWSRCVLRCVGVIGFQLVLWQRWTEQKEKVREGNSKILEWNSENLPRMLLPAPHSFNTTNLSIERAQKGGMGLFPITQPLFTTKLNRCSAFLLLNRLSHDALKVIVYASTLTATIQHGFPFLV